MIVNHETGELIWATEGHDEATLNRFFEQLTPEQRANIKGVSADGARWIDASLQKYCPNAVRCIDRFHVIQWANEALDKVRIETWRKSRIELAQLQKKYDITSKKLNDLKDKEQKTKEQAELDKLKKQIDEAKKEVNKIKNSKLVLGKAPENLSEAQIEKVKFATETDAALHKAYDLKELLRTIFNLPFEHAKEAIHRFFWKATHSRVPLLKELGHKIRRHEQHILNSIQHRLSNARVEATNKKIKGVIYKANGFAKVENFIAMIMLVCSNLKVPLAHRPGGLSLG